MPNGDVDPNVPNRQSYQDNGDGTMTDNVTGLIWQQATSEGTMTQAQGSDYCTALDLAGHHDWRLPSRIELLSLVNVNRYYPSINTDYFPATQAYWYWTSSSPYAGASGFGVVHFISGRCLNFEWESTNYVRCVR